MRKTAEKRQKNRRARMCGSCGRRSAHEWFDGLCAMCFRRIVNQVMARMLYACEPDSDAQPSKQRVAR